MQRNLSLKSSKNTTFTSSDAPEFKNNASEVFVHEGNDVSLTCEAEGSPPPVFNWTKDGVDMRDSTNNLNITQVITSATYQCVAFNYLGSITKQIRVHVIKTSWAATLAAMTTPEASAQTGTVCILISFT